MHRHRTGSKTENTNMSQNNNSNSTDNKRNGRALGYLALVVVLLVGGGLNAALKANAANLPSEVLSTLFSVLAIIAVIGVVASLLVLKKSRKIAASICGVVAFFSMGAAGSLTSKEKLAPINMAQPPAFVSDADGVGTFYREFVSYLQQAEPELVTGGQWVSGGVSVTVTDRWQELSFNQRATKVKQWYDALNRAKNLGGNSNVSVYDNNKTGDQWDSPVGNLMASLDGSGLRMQDSSGKWLINKNLQTQGIDTGWESESDK